ncbi:hypothetical protein ACFST9_00115 [Hymenobacter monticola]|uniref:Uncharacterized protein n=1 Tax=Hymenobacter monticola TaxID=1705399 RepID=A0ABY4BC78_9BACT|nr:hypothetical protein [Hymenobacter monticola]UOE36755.1 hypothetical protein MTP16_25495 [Hymenobacter monticola]
MNTSRNVEAGAEALLLTIFEVIHDKHPFAVLEEALSKLIAKKRLEWHNLQESTAYLSGNQLKIEIGIYNRRTDDEYYNGLDAAIIPDNYIKYAQVECGRDMYSGMVRLAQHLAQVEPGAAAATGFKWYKGKPAFFSGTSGILRYLESSLAVTFIWDILGGRLVTFKNKY